MNADTKLTRKGTIAAPAPMPFPDKRVGMAIASFVPAVFWTGLLDTLGPWFGLYFTSIFLGLVGLAIAVFATLVFVVVSRTA